MRNGVLGNILCSNNAFRILLQYKRMKMYFFNLIVLQKARKCVGWGR